MLMITDVRMYCYCVSMFVSTLYILLYNGWVVKISVTFI